MEHDLPPIKIKLTNVALDCTRFCVTKAFEDTVRDLTTKYKITGVTFSVKWEAQGSSTSTTHVRLALHREILKSKTPWKKPISLDLGYYDSSKHKLQTAKGVPLTEADEPLNLFWKPGEPGDSLVLVYSVLGAAGSKFIIHELKIEVRVRNIGATRIDKLTIAPRYIEGHRFNRSHIIKEVEFHVKVPFIFASFKGHVKWKRGRGAVLKLKFYKKDDDRHDSEFVGAELPMDKSDYDFVITPINFEYDEKLYHYKPRQPGDALVLAMELPNKSFVDIKELDITVTTKPYAKALLTKGVAVRKGKLRAFVVGISNYTYFNKLNNPVNDAKAIVESLSGSVESKDDIIFIFDCNSFQLFDAFKRFVNLCKAGDFVIIFFAGHGCAFQNHQCLLARGLTGPEKMRHLDGGKQTILESSLQVDTMLAQLRSKGVNKHLVLLDCCREFRIADRPRALNEKWEDKDKAHFNVEVGHGTVIGYATSPGDYASDGDCSDKHRGKTGHGYYTEALLKHLHKANTDVDYMLREVGAEVYLRSGKTQNPHRDSCLNDLDAYLFMS